MVGEGALLLDLESRRERRLPQLLRRVEADVEGPDPGERAAADVGAEEGLQGLVDRVPPEGVVGVGDGDEGQPSGLQHPADLAQGVHVAVHVLQDLGEEDGVEGLVREGEVVDRGVAHQHGRQGRRVAPRLA